MAVEDSVDLDHINKEELDRLAPPARGADRAEFEVDDVDVAKVGRNGCFRKKVYAPLIAAIVITAFMAFFFFFLFFALLGLDEEDLASWVRQHQQGPMGTREGNY